MTSPLPPPHGRPARVNRPRTAGAHTTSGPARLAPRQVDPTDPRCTLNGRQGLWRRLHLEQQTGDPCDQAGDRPTTRDGAIEIRRIRRQHAAPRPPRRRHERSIHVGRRVGGAGRPLTVERRACIEDASRTRSRTGGTTARQDDQRDEDAPSVISEQDQEPQQAQSRALPPVTVLGMGMERRRGSASDPPAFRTWSARPATD